MDGCARVSVITKAMKVLFSEVPFHPNFSYHYQLLHHRSPTFHGSISYHAASHQSNTETSSTNVNLKDHHRPLASPQLAYRFTSPYRQILQNHSLSIPNSHRSHEIFKSTNREMPHLIGTVPRIRHFVHFGHSPLLSDR